MIIARLLLGVLLLTALTGCGDDPKDDSPKRAYAAGGQYDAEDYVGPTQAVTGVRVDPDVTKLHTERKCKTKKNGKCKAWAVKSKTVVTDDQDWVLILPDGTEVDVDEATWRAHPIGSLYP